MEHSVATFVAIQKNDLRLKRRFIRDTSNPFEIPEERFIKLYRLPISLAISLIEELKPYVEVSAQVDAIPFHIQVLSALNFFATGSYQRRVGGDMFSCVSQTKISEFISKISKLISEKMSYNYISFPMTPVDITAKINRFDQLHNMPGVIGIIDCTRTAITAVNRYIEYAYVNRKGFHSINVQAICDADKRILNINARYPGSNHDSFIWTTSLVYTWMEQMYREHGEQNYYLLGDSGYPLQPWLLTPYSHPRTNAEKIFNDRHSRVRSGIEQCFGILKMRFRCLLGERKLRYSHFKCGHIIYSCATLHNYLIANGYDINRDVDISTVPSNFDVQPNTATMQHRLNESGTYHRVGMDKRNRIASILNI